MFNSEFTYNSLNEVSGNVTTRALSTNGNMPTEMRFGAAWATEDNTTDRERSLLSVLEMYLTSLTTMYCMFFSCTNLTSIDVSSFNTSNVTDMNCMFYRCRSLTSLDLSNFDTSKVRDIGWMFYDCEKLITLNLNNCDLNRTSDHEGVFNNCYELAVVSMDNSDVDSINDIISLLPTRTADSPGTLKTGAIPASDCDITTANSKYWNIDGNNSDPETQISFFIGNTTLDSIRLGSYIISKIYLGGILLYKKQ